jgi:predicted DNA-binding transcriptional regulator AlpA
MWTIKEFCAYARISRALYYRLQDSGEGPLETRLGHRVLIAQDTAAAWLKSREQPAKVAG